MFPILELNGGTYDDSMAMGKLNKSKNKNTTTTALKVAPSRNKISPFRIKIYWMWRLWGKI